MPRAKRVLFITNGLSRVSLARGRCNCSPKDDLVEKDRETYGLLMHGFWLPSIPLKKKQMSSTVQNSSNQGVSYSWRTADASETARPNLCFLERCPNSWSLVAKPVGDESSAWRSKILDVLNIFVAPGEHSRVEDDRIRAIFLLAVSGIVPISWFDS